MLALLRSLSAPLVSLVFMMMASGFFNTFVSVRLEMEGYRPENIGIVISALYLGILIGSFRIDRWISKMGHARSFVIFAATLACIALAQAFWIDSWYWAALRLAGGICMAGILVVIESWVLVQSSPNMRGTILSIYLTILYAALSSGQLLIRLFDPRSVFPFCMTAVLLLISTLPVSMRKLSAPKLKEPARLKGVQLFRISPFGFFGGCISGMLLAVVYGLAPVYAREIGMGVSEIGTFMAVLIFGGFSLQWPLGRWADRGDRRRVLNVVCFITTLLGISIALLGQISLYFLFVLVWLFGGFSFTLYPLSMAYACERVKEEQIVAVTGGFVLSYGTGAIAGPLVASLAMDLLGSGGLFYFLATISLLLGLIGLKRPAPAILDE